MYTAEMLLEFEFINQATILKVSDQYFAIISLISKYNIKNCLRKITNIAPKLKIIVLDYLPINDDGEINGQLLLKNIFLEEDGLILKKIKENISNKKNISLERNFLIDSPFFLKGIEKKGNETSYKNINLEKENARTSYTKNIQKNSYTKKPQNLLVGLENTVKNFNEKGLVYINETGTSRFTSYKELLEKSKKIATYLSKKSIKKKSNLILCFEEHDTFFECLWGTIANQSIPISITLPQKLTSLSASSEKFYNTWNLLEKPKVLTSIKRKQDFENLMKIYADLELDILFYEEAIDSSALNSDKFYFSEISQETPVFYQLTSGSTGTPKCIVEKHSNIIEHIIGSADFNNYSSNDTSLNWIPTDHVVPIITCHFRDVVLGCNQIHAASSFIISKPLNWLDLIDKYAVSITWAPNFGYKLLTNAAKDNSLDKFSLKSIRYFMNAGEQVTPMTMRDFVSFLTKKNIALTTIQPSFGMAEVATCMTYNNQFNPKNSILKIKKSSFQDPLTIASDEDTDYFEFVNLGSPISTCEIRIVDENNAVEPELKVGMLQIKGPILSGGYFNNLIANKAFNEDGWFSTGDLGFIYNSCLFVTGREKETIIIRGQNFFCYEIEDFINKIDGVKPTFSAVTSSYNDSVGTEELIIFYVLDAEKKLSYEKIISDIQLSVSKNFSISPKYIIDIPERDFPKTSSGKIQRSLLKQKFDAGYYNWKIESSKKHDDTLIFHQKKWGLKNHQSLSVFTIKDCSFLEEKSSHLSKYIKKTLKEDCFFKPASLSQAIKNNILIVMDCYNKFENKNLSEQVFYISNLLKDIAKNPGLIKRIALISKRIFRIGHDDLNLGYEQGWLPGLINSLKKELILPFIALIDLEGNDEEQDYSLIKNEIQAGLKDTFIAYRQSKRYIPFLKQYSHNLSTNIGSQPYFQENQFYLVIGATGGIGNLLTQHLVDKYKVNLILTGTQDIQAKRYSFLSEKQKVHYVKLNLTEKNILEEKLDEFKDSIKGIIYLAGITKHEPVDAFNNTSINNTLNIKGLELKKIYEYCYKKNKQVKLLAFSSVISILGSAEFSLYAASNSLCESVCDYLEAKYQNSISYIAWPPWDQIGMAKAFNYKKYAGILDFNVIEKNEALKYFDQVISLNSKQVFLGLNPLAKSIRSLLNQMFFDFFEIKISTSLKKITTDLISKLNSIEITDNLNKSIRLLLKNETKKALSNKINSNSIAEILFEEAWKKHFNIKEFDRNTSFFQLGGDSLSAINLLMSINEIFNIKISMQELFDHQDFNSLLKKIMSAKQQYFSPKPITLEKYSLSLDQQRILYLCQTGQNLSYNVYKSYNIQGKLNLINFKQSISLLLQYYPSLCTHFFYGEEEINQEIIDFKLDDVFSYQENIKKNKIPLLIESVIKTEFNLFDKKPLIKIKIFSESDLNHILLINIHHLICDEWSLGLLLNTLSKTYNNLCKNINTPLIKLANTHFFQFVNFQKNSDKKIPAQLIEKIQPTNKPLFKETTLGKNQFKGRLIKKNLNKKQFLALKEIAKQNFTTPAIIYHALFSLALFLYSDKNSLNIGIPITSREDVSLKNVFGLLVNTTIIGSLINPNDSLISYLSLLRASYITAQLNRHISFSDLVSKLKETNKYYSTTPLLETMFVYEDFINSWSISDVEIKELIIHNETAKFPLTCFIKFPKENNPVICIEYDLNIATEGLANKLLLNLEKIINDFIKLPNLKITISELLAN